MKKLRTIVVEDERLPRLSLLSKLEDYKDTVEVIDSCDSYESARDSILRSRPDLLFLDIQLQGRDAIQLLEELRQTMRLPYVIFTTAYSDRKYLMSAIKLSAVDYLLKPVGKSELSHAVAKAAQRAAGTGSGEVQKLSFKAVGSTLFVDSEEIAWIKAEGNYSTLVTFGREDLVLESLLSLEQRLPESGFVRLDRSTIVNVKKVSRLSQQERTCTLLSSDGRTREVELSKSGIEKLLSYLAG